MSRVKLHLFRNYGWYAAAAAAISVILYANAYLRPELFGGLIGGILSFLYFFQKQKLKEISLFQSLFDKFNERYNKMNERLNRILMMEENIPLSPDEIFVLYDYFNLCAEEYLYFRLGYILPEVWEAWYNGMLIYYRNLRIRPLWDKEIKTNSYYGFKISLP